MNSKGTSRRRKGDGSIEAGSVHGLSPAFCFIIRFRIRPDRRRTQHCLNNALCSIDCACDAIASSHAARARVILEIDCAAGVD